MHRSTRRNSLLALASYALAAVAFAWPLPARLSTMLPGHVGGDTGVYVWNLWVFRTELLEQGRIPLSTTRIFSADVAADLSLHNFTVFADLVALPVLPVAGPVAAYNVVWLLMPVIGAFTMFLLARHVLSHLPSGPERGDASPASEWVSWTGAWLAGLLFGFSPALVARSTEHLSLMSAAPLAAFSLAWLRALREGRARWGIAAGVFVAWALASDPYYGVYCLMLGAFFLAADRIEFGAERRARHAKARCAGPAVDALLLALALFGSWVAVTGGGELRVGRLVISATTLYTPALLFASLVGARLAMLFAVSMRWRGTAACVRADARLLTSTGITTAVLTFPLLWALARRAADGNYPRAPVLWRSSMPGVDLLSFVMPNPNHPWLGALSRPFLTGLPGGYAENVASVTLVALGVIVFACARDRLRLPGRWFVLATLFASLAAGPFLLVGGFNTGLPTPWTPMRYLPVVGDARAPARFAAVMIMAVAILLAIAVRAILERRRGRALAWGSLIAALLVFELAPVPRELYSAEVPSIYKTIAADPRNVTVLELPFGARDGLTSTGDCSASAQFYQSFHGKRLMGGYLSRVSPARHTRLRRFPLRGALIRLSEGKQLEPGAALRYREHPTTWRRHLGYVVIDRSRATPALVEFAVDVLDLEKIGESLSRELYRPRSSGPAIMVDADSGR